MTGKTIRMASIVGAFLLLFAGAAQAQGKGLTPYQEGLHYFRIDNATALPSDMASPSMARVLAALLHHLNEGLEQVVGVVGSGARFRVVLHAVELLIRVCEARHGVVVEVYVGDPAALGQAVPLNREAMVLAGDLHLARVLVAHRVVAATVTELQLEGARPHRQSEDLVSQADAEHR